MTESVLKKSGTLLSNRSVARDSLDMRVSSGFDKDLCTHEIMLISDLGGVCYPKVNASVSPVSKVITASSI